MIISNIMDAYGDSGYLKYVLELDFTLAYKLYKKCIQKLRDHEIEKVKDKYWDLWLREGEIENGYRGSFEDYCSERIKTTHPEQKQLDKDSETERILNKYKVEKPLAIERVIV